MSEPVVRPGNDASDTGAHLGHALYFIDVLACLLFALALAVSVARFDSDFALDVSLPEAPSGDATGAGLTGLVVTVEGTGLDARIRVGEQPVALDTLEAHLRELAPPELVVRSEASALARVVGLAHAAGVGEIRLAYQPERPERVKEMP